MNSPLATQLNVRFRGASRQMVSFAAIGIASTAAYVGLFALLRNVTSAAIANDAALVITAVANTAANRRLTFNVRGREGLARDHAAGLAALAVALVLTSASLAALDVFAPHRGRLLEMAVLVAANAAATLLRFLLLRVAIGAERPRRVPVPVATTVATLPTFERTRG
jgi:putative flippase GtrA